MELYLDSVRFEEVAQIQKLGYLKGLTTTPTFMYRDGITDVDQAIIDLSGMVEILQVEALGDSAEEVVSEAERLLALGLDPKRTVFKIPVSLEGTRACKMLVDMGLMVNIHLVYTLQQAYMAFTAGATYVCPLVGRLQDQGHDALGLVEDCVDVVDRYGYESKVMFSSVRHMEHVKNAMTIGAHACTVPWGILKQLTENHFTTLGTDQFTQHTNLLTKSVGDVFRKNEFRLQSDATISNALFAMTSNKTGAVLVLNGQKVHRIFTDGDLRRVLEKEGESALQMPLDKLDANHPSTVKSTANLKEAKDIFKEKEIDTLVVLDEDNNPVGLLDIQDII